MVMVMVIVMVMVRGTGQARLSGVFAQKKSFVEYSRGRKEDGSPRPLSIQRCSVVIPVVPDVLHVVVVLLVIKDMDNRKILEKSGF